MHLLKTSFVHKKHFGYVLVRTRTKVAKSNVPDMPTGKTVMWPGTQAGIFGLVQCNSNE